ncbi:MAG: hypothetical protein KatS3mg129_2722 [Leptospiraceae bacterium]|nr:MAG: hypothetical protein KatS3mg129_2722 [Leptospiraceae bacterium]
MLNKKSRTPSTPLKILNIKQQYHKQIEEVANELDNAIKQHKLLKECIKNKPFCRGFIVSEKVIIKPDILVLGKRPTWYKEHDQYQNDIVEYWCPVLPPEESCSNKNQKLTIFENNKYQLLVEKDFIAPIFAKYFNNKNCKFQDLNFTFLDLYWLRCNGEELDSLLKHQETSKILE